MTDVSSLQAMKEHLSSVQAEIEQLQALALKKSGELFSTEAAKLFEAFPIVKSVTWDQYTPYFNDGEECTFSANCPTKESSWGELHFNVEEDDDPYESGQEWCNKSEEELGVEEPNPDYDPNERYKPYSQQNLTKRDRTVYTRKPNPDYDPAYGEAEKVFEEFFKQFREADYKAMFGDHVRCTLTKNGVEVNHVDHD